MKVVLVCFVYNPDFSSEDELLKTYYTTTQLAESLSKKGADVTVVQRFHRESEFIRDNVKYCFVKDKFSGRLKFGEIAFATLKKIMGQNADIIHLHSSLQTPVLRLLLSKKTAIVIQNHGGPGPTGIHQKLFRIIDGYADALFFTTVKQGEQWYKHKMPERKILPVMEGSNSFEFGSRNESRKITGLTGDPAFLWVGHLNENKDPLTVLNGFAEVVKVKPQSRLYMIYGSEGMLAQVRATIDADLNLKTTVTLLGNIPHDKMEMFYNSADYFVLGSHAEGSGYALSEALACGCVPVVPDIPSFTMLTDNGRLGALWKAGDKDSFAVAAKLALGKDLNTESSACVDYFKKMLTFDAIAETTLKHYEKVLKLRRN